jgi:DNA-binding transcriptional MerR regulator
VKRSLGTKLYYSIGEVADLTQLQPHTLRAWEKEFSCLRPKRMGKNRAYRERDIGVILLIRRLLYQERYSTRGAQLRLKNEPELIRAAADNVGAFLTGDRDLPPAIESDGPEEDIAIPPSTEASPAGVTPPSSSAGASTETDEHPAVGLNGMDDRLRQQVVGELRELVSLLR